MAKFNEYTQKATPADNDTLMIYDATAKANKLSPFSGIWNWIVGKLTNAVISNLQTSNKSVIGALNELNSNHSNLALEVDVTNIQALISKASSGTCILFHLSGTSYTGNDLPIDSKYKYGSGIIFYRNSNSCKIVLFPEEVKPVWKMAKWTKWRDFANSIVD